MIDDDLHVQKLPWLFKTFYCQFNHYGSFAGTLSYDIKTCLSDRNGVISGSVTSVWCKRITFSAHAESVYDIMPSNTCCVGNEQQFEELTTVEHDMYPQSSD